MIVIAVRGFLSIIFLFFVSHTHPMQDKRIESATQPSSSIESALSPAILAAAAATGDLPSADALPQLDVDQFEKIKRLPQETQGTTLEELCLSRLLTCALSNISFAHKMEQKLAPDFLLCVKKKIFIAHKNLFEKFCNSGVIPLNIAQGDFHARSSDEHLLLIGDTFGNITLVDLRKFPNVRQCVQKTDPITSLALSTFTNTVHILLLKPTITVLVSHYKNASLQDCLLTQILLLQSAF